MAKFSNVIEYSSSDGLPKNPYPLKAVPTTCTNESCGEEVTENPCPYCGTENEIEHEPDFEAGQQEYDKYD